MPVTENAVMLGSRGTFGKTVVFRQVGGRTITSAYPDMSKRVLSPKQIEVNKKMTRANQVVQMLMEMDKERDAAQIRLNVPRNKLYTTLIREFFKDPETFEKNVIAEYLVYAKELSDQRLAAATVAKEENTAAQE